MTATIQPPPPPPPPALPPPPPTGSAPQGSPLWSTMPGWGIATNLIPSELINSRQLKVLRKVLLGGLVLLVLICSGSYYLAMRSDSDASDSLAEVQAQTLVLQSDASKYATGTKVQSAVTAVQTQVATLMAGDVDLPKLMGLIRSNLPATMTITSESVTIVAAAVAAAGGGGLDTSGLARIGNVTLSGGGKTLDDLAAYVDKLKVITGFTEVMPTSNTAAAGKETYNITLGLTSALISHRFDVVKTVTK